MDSQIFTTTPMKTLLEEKQNAKEEKLRKNNRSREESKIRTVKRQVFSNFADNNVSEEKNNNTVTKQKPELRDRSKVTYNFNSDDEDKENSDVEINEDICIMCGEFGKDRELWIRCVHCSGWAHKACTDGEAKKIFICDFCQ
ncbi:uncharacterized protein LOC123322376 [Coccinella septempunctata]|uniref:uncharacterized protein LOC123322376 n=1 Tax=Coccinella septempunctata TaxID=41139 RepID=UPI001D07CF66|nr:uncharacterized protein LOC123322376 [Coccinella septempunctata]